MLLLMMMAIMAMAAVVIGCLGREEHAALHISFCSIKACDGEEVAYGACLRCMPTLHAHGAFEMP